MKKIIEQVIMEIHENNLICLLENCVQADPEQILYVFQGRRLSAAEIWDKVLRLRSNMMKLGIHKGSRVLLMLPNVPEYVISYFAILSVGAIVVPINVMLREREIHHMMEDCEARAIFAADACKSDVLAAAQSMSTLQSVVIHTDQESPEYFRLDDLLIKTDEDAEWAEFMLDDTAVILYTSGHTGRPKGAELAHKGLIDNAEASMNLLYLRSKDVVLGVLPFSHAYGQTAVMNAALIAQATVILLPEFDPEAVLKAVQDNNVTIFLGTPAMYSLILSFPNRKEYNFSSVRYCISGGSELKPELLQSFEDEFQTTLLEGYGLCETTAVATFNHVHRERRPGSIGTPIEKVHIRLVDDSGKEVSVGNVGEIAIKSAFMMKGYLHHPEATRDVLREGWFYTGDLARADEQGFLYILGRKTDMIVKGGFNVYPAEIERLLLSHPDIQEAAVIGISDNVHGEEIKACIVPREGITLAAEQIGEYCRQHMARYKCPRFIQFYQKLPKNPYGRISRKKLREMSGNITRE